MGIVGASLRTSASKGHNPANLPGNTKHTVWERRVAMDEEIFESTAQRSLDDFEWLAVANGSPDLAERLERSAPAFFKAVVAS
jgi:hypothetical protein